MTHHHKNTSATTPFKWIPQPPSSQPNQAMTLTSGKLPKRALNTECAVYSDSSQMSDIKSQPYNNSQRYNRLEASFASSGGNGNDHDKELIIKYIDELKYSDLRDNALLELSRQREHFQELAPFIWHSVGTIPALLLEIVSVYPLLSPPLLDSKTSNKACNVLAML